MEQYTFASEPLANSASIVEGPNFRFSMLNDRVLRYEWSEDGIFEDRASTFAINRKFPTPKFRVDDSDTQLIITTPALQLTYDKKRFSQHGFSVVFESKQTEWGASWNYGDPPQDNLGGTARTLDMVDGPCDMGVGIISRAGYAALDDSKSMLFDGNGFVAGRRPGDRIDGYIFTYGYDFKGAMSSFYAISGKQPMVPRWALGNWWSRYHAYSEKEYLDLMDQFRSEDIPLSVAVIDMDWHLVKEPEVQHVGWTGYTWNRKLFPDPRRFTKALHDKGLKITMNEHPHAGVYSFEEAYESMAEALGHDTTKKAPIPFDATSPEYMHAHLNVLHRKLEEDGCDFWWIDWQQGGYSRVAGMDPLWLLNHFQYLDHQLNKKGSLPLVFSRYAGPGSHRYPVGFSGDSVANWNSLAFQPEFTATASNIGYGWWSHDIGGHLWGYRDDECTARWVQLGAFSPILRLHSTVSRWQSKEPWRYRPEPAAAMRKSLQLRHRLVPYIYSITSGEHSGLPLIQPIYWTFPTRDVAFRFPNQFYFGPTLVVSPIVSPRDKRTNLAKVKSWVPPGRHVDIMSGAVYDGDRELNLYRPLDQIPILAPEGSIIPLDKAHAAPNGCPNPDAFEVLVVVGANGHFEIIEDIRDDIDADGTDQNTRNIAIKYDHDKGQLTTVASAKAWTFRFVSFVCDLSQLRVSVNGSDHAAAESSVEQDGASFSTVISIAKLTDKDASIVIDLGASPSPAIIDYTDKINDFIVDFQIENNLKDKIWEIVKAPQNVAVKMTRLLTLGLDEDLFGPLVELMLSDSRSEFGGCCEQ